VRELKIRKKYPAQAIEVTRSELATILSINKNVKASPFDYHKIISNEKTKNDTIVGFITSDIDEISTNEIMESQNVDITFISIEEFNKKYEEI